MESMHSMLNAHKPSSCEQMAFRRVTDLTGTAFELHQFLAKVRCTNMEDMEVLFAIVSRLDVAHHSGFHLLRTGIATLKVVLLARRLLISPSVTSTQINARLTIHDTRTPVHRRSIH
jgi:hypothetical protein